MRGWQIGMMGFLAVLWCSSAAMAETIQGLALVKGADDHRDIVVHIEGLEWGERSAKRPEVAVDQHRLVFVPHILPVAVGSEVDIRNSDSLLHDIFLLDTDGTRRAFRSFGRDHTISHVFEKPGVATLLCRRHQEMWASILVLTNSHYAVTERDGRYVIAGVPPGTYSLTVWHERWHPVSRQVKVVMGQGAEVDFELGSSMSDRAR